MSSIFTKKSMYDELKFNEKMMNFYTDLPSKELFQIVLSLVNEKVYMSAHH